MRDRVLLTITWIILLITFAGACRSMAAVSADMKEMDSRIEEDQKRILHIRDTYYPDVYLETIPMKEQEEESTEASVPLFTLPEDEIDLMARVVHAEAGNQSMEGKRLVADVILNRVDDPRFPGNVYEVLTADGQFMTVENGAIYRYTPDITDYGAVIAELQLRSNSEVLYFSSKRYIRKPVLKEGGHYFSK